MAALQGRLLAGENVLATLEVDLDAQGRFAQGLLALTNSRLLAFEPSGGGWTEFRLAVGQSLKLSDHGGLAFMELFSPERRLARWRFTLACNPAAVRFADAFERELQRLAGQAPREVEAEGRRTRSTSASPASRPAPGCCCGCGASRGPTAASCCWALR